MARSAYTSALVVSLTALLIVPSPASERAAAPSGSPLWGGEDVLATDSASVSAEPDADPTALDDCRGGAWQDVGFTNQGQCIRFVMTGTDSR